MVSHSDIYNGSELKYGIRDLHDMGSPGQNQVQMMESLIRLTGVWGKRFAEIPPMVGNYNLDLFLPVNSMILPIFD